jgi:hypothetical protein
MVCSSFLYFIIIRSLTECQRLLVIFRISHLIRFITPRLTFQQNRTAGAFPSLLFVCFFLPPKSLFDNFPLYSDSSISIWSSFHFQDSIQQQNKCSLVLSSIQRSYPSKGFFYVSLHSKHHKISSFEYNNTILCLTGQAKAIDNLSYSRSVVIMMIVDEFQIIRMEQQIEN